MKKLISLVMTIAVLLSISQSAWAAEETFGIESLYAGGSGNVIVIVPGIIGSELVDGNGAKVWVGLLSAGKSIFISNTGYTTIQKVNYTISGGKYSVSSFVSTNDGDGTVTATSAQNNLGNTNTHVAKLKNSGNHVDMVSNSNAIAKVCQYVTQSLAGYSLSSIEDDEIKKDYVNEKGWVVGDGIDGRRVRVIIRGSDMPTVISSAGEPCTLIGEQLYVGEKANEENYVGECWVVSDGYQFELMSDNYTFVYDDDDKKGINVEVSYMESGYYKAVQTYNVEETEGRYELSTGENALETPEMKTYDGIVIKPSTILNHSDVQKLNLD